MAIVDGSISEMELTRELQRPLIRLRFSPKIEAAFRKITLLERARRMVVTGVFATFIDLAFLPIDYQMMNDVFWHYVIARVFLFSPAVYIVAYLVHKNPQKWFTDLIPGLMCIFLTSMIMLIFTQSHSIHRAANSYGSFLIILYALVVQRLPMGYAFWTAMICSAIQIAGVYTVGSNDPNLMLSLMTFFLCGSALLLAASYVLESGERRVFLLTLRAELLNRKLEQLAKCDPLTGLGNRRCFDDATGAFWANGAVEPTTASIILLDIDRFKIYNDTYGHLAGDECLETIARCVRETTREQDVPVRFGGEEMLVFLPDADFTTARQLAEKIRLAIRAAAIPFFALGDDCVVTASFGVATGLTMDTSPVELIARADNALYAAKKSGRDRVWPPIQNAVNNPEVAEAKPITAGR